MLLFSPFPSAFRQMAGYCLTLGLLISPAVAQPVSTTDQRGVVVTLPSKPQRIVTIPIPAASVMIAVDQGARNIIGLHPTAKAAIQQGVLGSIFPETLTIRSDITAQGFMPNVETLLQLKPDLIVQWANQGPDLIPAVERLGLPVIGLNYGTEALLRGQLKMYGELLGKEERVRDLIGWRNDMQGRLAKALEGLTDDKKPKVMTLQLALTTFQVAAPGSYQDANMRLAGGRNVAAELKDFVTVNPEQIVAWAPDIILLNSFEAKLFPKDIYDNPLFAGVPAVKNRRVYKTPLGGQRWDPPSHESPLTWLWMTSLFHPDRIMDNLRAEMIRGYQLLYGYTLSAAQIDTILFIEQHKEAVDYARFRQP